ncbi:MULTISPECIES: BrnA antitoxin family protein [Halocynthiibacter]|uniref:BrnA antitoxin family protein n=1 Tax=Halocynthiibacter halioticoli TaxID=2986804 RepID=A0AAE3LQI6_9RHOB|nr:MULTISPECIES: BrnA antitoxin family protein [Halocynthiibacter]MCV6823558.1 BrnA antitoxin family protein [Halocynthiibacter halioticoli]MCW4056559.1 BrnA antitoxin family protein [Halocynthiibacter sp. SDUM655004]MDE0590477.1 BrnA antitoxin family protein [Halocynthiibacter sp. C4]
MAEPYNFDPSKTFEAPEGRRRRSRGEHLARLSLERTIARLATEMYPSSTRERFVPDAWEDLADAFPVQPRRARVTLLLEEPVLKFYRSYGSGYQRIINDVLALYAELRIAKVIEARED